LPLIMLSFSIKGQVEFVKVESQDEMQAARKKASDQMLMLFVDVYADWCGPCKMMDSEVFSNPAVSEYMSDYYLGVKVDGESDFGRIFAAEQGLEGYPSMFVFTDEGELISKIVGYTPAAEMLNSLRSIKEGYAKIRTYSALYQSGRLEAEDFADYITVIRDMGNQEEAERLSEEYVEKVMGPELADNDIRVVAFYMDLNDAWWKDFSSDKERLIRILEDDYMLAMEKIYNKTLVKAVEEDRVDLVSLMANELAPLVEDETTSRDLRSLPFIQYYYYTNRITELISYVDQRFASDRKNDHRWLFGAASQITDMDQQYLTEVLLIKELEWYAACIRLEEQYDYYFYEGMVHLFLRDGNEARESFLKAEALASTQEQKAMVEQVLGYINSQ
jgi:thioredoxin-related protein